MKLLKYNKYKDKVYTTSVATSESAGSSSSSSSSGDRTLWGNNDSGNDMEGSMRVQGNIYVMGQAFEEDENGERVPTTRGGEASSRAGDEFPPSSDDGEGNLFLDGNLYAGGVITKGNITAGEHIYMNSPHTQHNGEKKCVGELIADEVKRATDAEETLDKSIQICEQSIKNNADEIVALKNRTTANETAIDAEVSRAQNAEDNLDASIQICEQSIRNNADEIVALKKLLPAGAIIMYNGTTAPEGWAKCDGSDGRPNLTSGNTSIIYIVKV